MIQADNLSLQRGQQLLLQNAQFTIFPGQRVGLVGANGSGKSSLFALLKGELKEDTGTLQVPAGWKIASVAQETPAMDCSALEYVIAGDAEYMAVQAALNTADAAADGTRIASLHGELDAIGGYQIEARAAALLDGLGFSPREIQQPVRAFSGGWRMRLNLAQALISRADLMLLDEPTNHLDLDTILWLEGWLRQFPGTVIIISHDRDFLDGVVSHIIHIEQQQTNCYQGDYSSFQRQRAERRAQQQQQYDKEQAQRAHLQKFVDRFRAQANKAKQAQSRLKALEKLTASAPLSEAGLMDLSFPEPDKLPNPIMQLDQVQAGYGETTVLAHIQLNLVPGSRIGLLGRNGAGKSTLMKLLAGELAPQQGTREVSNGLAIGYFAQHQLETLSPADHAMAHLLRLDPTADELRLRNFLGRFGFSGDRAFEPTGPFSGGEKARLVLALLIYQKPNLLLLDEPTNHLDLDLREALTSALQNFSGAMVVVSHDRHFLQATVDDYYLVTNQRVEPFQGGLDSYARWLEEQANLSRQAHKLAANEHTNTVAQAEESSGASRKAQRQAAAEQRRRLKPLKDQLRQTEKQLATAEAKLAAVEAELADPDLYNGDQQQKLTDLMQQQGQLQQDLNDLEQRWLELEEELEAHH